MAARNQPEVGRAWTPEIVRKRIRIAHIVRALQRHIFGDSEMSATQVRAAEVLLRKALPDQSAMQHSGAIEWSKADELPDGLLSHIAAGGRAGTAEQASGQAEPIDVH